MADFNLKEGDLLPRITGVLTDADGNVISLAGASVRFVMAGSDGVAKVDAAASIDSAAAGAVSYGWTGTDTDTPGDYVGEWRVTFPASKPETFPNQGYVTITIEPKLG